jgi:hypothetical protein
MDYMTTPSSIAFPNCPCISNGLIDEWFARTVEPHTHGDRPDKEPVEAAPSARDFHRFPRCASMSARPCINFRLVSDDDLIHVIVSEQLHS